MVSRQYKIRAKILNLLGHGKYKIWHAIGGWNKGIPKLKGYKINERCKGGRDKNL